MPFKVNLKDIFCYISLNTCGLYLSPECFLNFPSNFCILPLVGKIFKCMVLTFQENALNPQSVS